MEELIQAMEKMVALNRAKTASITINMDQFRDALGKATCVELENLECASEAMQDLLLLFSASIAATAWSFLTGIRKMED